MSFTFNLADMWEAMADRVPDRVALVVDDDELTFAQLEERANRLSHWLRDHGIGEGDHVGMYLYNGTPYVEGMLAAYKLRAVPINVNYRYVDEELRYLFNDADLKAVLFDHEFQSRVDAVKDDVATLDLLLRVGGADDEYEPALAASAPERIDIDRSPDDRYIIYTGGTTGMPKGVEWRQEDAFYSCFGGGDYSRQNPITKPEELFDRMMAAPLVFFPIAPLMHGAAQWTVLAWMFGGGTAVLTAARPRTDYERVWRLISDRKVNIITIIGDAVARPLIDELQAHPERYDTSSLLSIGSGAVPLSPAGRAELQEVFPGCMLNDGYGASETGAQAGNLGDGRFKPYDGETTVLDPETLEEIKPGSGAQGRVARRGHIPLGYYGDPVKTAETFVERDGVRWVLTGDVATVLEDGTIQLFGRGSMCINSGGEKVFPEEVEAALVAHPQVYDTLVVGVPDPRWGERVAAVVQLAPHAALTEEDLVEHCRRHIAAYKVPRSILFVEQVRRSPAGKADYGWAKQVAAEAVG